MENLFHERFSGQIRTSSKGLRYPGIPGNSQNCAEMETASDFSGSWPASNIISQLPLLEQKLYGSKFKLDNSSDSDYLPPRQVRTAMKMGSAQDVLITMEGGINTESTGLGNSKWVGGSSMDVPETVSYTQTKSQNELMLAELEKVNTDEAVPAVEGGDVVMVEEEEVIVMGMEARMARMETVIGLMRDEIDELRDFKEITETEGCKFCIKNSDKLANVPKTISGKVVPNVLAIPLGPRILQRTVKKRETTPKEKRPQVGDEAPVKGPSYEREMTFAQKAQEGTVKKEF